MSFFGKYRNDNFGGTCEPGGGTVLHEIWKHTSGDRPYCLEDEEKA